MSFTVPLDAEFRKTSGSYCSLKCALLDNECVNRPLRGVDECQQRVPWILAQARDASLGENEKRYK